ncbi:S66 peptidase family protein [Clostridium tyrobutyricum]|uniref:S66 peptidase family protein n=1 Tax=Clostridium tyrobutyricum TaxID=1519 RepID=UPI001C387DE9|nr:LD-carboxypeptidase [Clostridium tyrobutyricum]MBV4416370.1 LD-carboxypeptidase [Clostridium tyrobutyricum]MBV4423335.1 LD-carboxypeptidase [Clostridium tyrobutyricum]
MLGNRLVKNSTIGLVSPAGPLKYEDIQESVEFLKKLGFNVKEGKHIYDKWGYLAGKDEDRAQDLMDMFLDTTVDMILCVRGGYGTMRILPLIDFNIIKNNPKIFAGFSDITTLINNIYQKCGIITFHSPMCNSNFQDKITLESFLNVLTYGYKPFTIKNPEEKSCNYFINSNYFNEPSANGILVGGNLSLLSSTIGTPYEIDTRNKILFIEDISEDPYKIDRMMTQLILSGKIKACNGIILGQFHNCTLPNYNRSLTLDEVLEDRILSFNKPTIVNFQCGHSYPRLTLPIGANVKMDCVNQTIHVLEPVVK